MQHIWWWKGWAPLMAEEAIPLWSGCITWLWSVSTFVKAQIKEPELIHWPEAIYQERQREHEIIHSLYTQLLLWNTFWHHNQNLMLSSLFLILHFCATALIFIYISFYRQIPYWAQTADFWPIISSKSLVSIACPINGQEQSEMQKGKKAHV